jgi:tetratricopeptide (TPR) repeat protein
LLGAEGDFAGAITRYKEIIGRVCKPELQQAIGELYRLMDKSDEAEPWFEQALLAYLKSVERGEVHYYHHLADFYADVRQDGEEAVKWAQRDYELRQNFATESALAWACYRDGRFDVALGLINRALSSGVRDARLLNGAAMIQKASGRAEESECLLKQAIEINPRYESFHVHH